MSAESKTEVVVDGNGSPDFGEGQIALDINHGTSQDEMDMHRLGRKQELSRNFRGFSILGLCVVVMNTWVAMLSSVYQAQVFLLTDISVVRSAAFTLIDGGLGGTMWVYTATWILAGIVILCLAEMASMAPTSGGQYHWVSEFAPPSLQKPMSYLAGWLVSLGWQVFLASAAFATGELILICASTMNPSYVPTNWQGSLMTWLIGLLTAAFNIWGSKWLPFFEGSVFIFNIVGFFAILIPLWVLAPMKSASEVFGDFQNYGGWSSIGAACIVGQLGPTGSLIGADSAVHMAEEVVNASLNVPWMMFGSITLNGIMGFIMMATYCAVIQDLEVQVVNSTAAYPYINIWADAIGSQGGAVAMCIPVILLSIAIGINSMAAASRQAWSFARDEGLPWPRWFTQVKVIGGNPTPVNATIGCLFITFIAGLLQLGGTEVFDSLFGLGGGALSLTYSCSIGSLLWRRFQGRPLPKARFSLGRFGAPLNAFAVLYQLFVFVIGFFPLFAKVDVAGMNWGVVMFVGVFLLCCINFAVRARKVYQGPVVLIKRDEDE